MKLFCMKCWKNIQAFRYWHWSWMLLLVIWILSWFIYQVFPAENDLFWNHSPTLSQGLIFGTYYQQNLVWVVSQCTLKTLHISFFAIFFSGMMGLVMMLGLFLEKTQGSSKIILRITVYLPRLFFLFLWCLVWRLHEPSHLSADPIIYVIVGLGLSGGFFLASQSQNQIHTLRSKLFIYQAMTPESHIIGIFFRHILPNSTIFFISIAKQLRENMIALSFLTFLGVVHLEPGDIGTFIYQLYNNSDAFYQGWWVLFFPCAMLAGIIGICSAMATWQVNFLKNNNSV